MSDSNDEVAVEFLFEEAAEEEEEEEEGPSSIRKASAADILAGSAEEFSFGRAVTPEFLQPSFERFAQPPSADVISTRLSISARHLLRPRAEATATVDASSTIGDSSTEERVAEVVQPTVAEEDDLEISSDSGDSSTQLTLAEEREQLQAAKRQKTLMEVQKMREKLESLGMLIKRYDL